MVKQRLKSLRRALKLTQRTVADELHITRAAVSAYENGRRTPSYDILVHFSKYYRTTTDYLLGATDDPEPPPQLDPLSRQILECYRSSGPEEQAFIYRQNMFIQEILRFEQR